MQLERFLQAQNFYKLELHKNNVGQLTLIMKYDERPLRLILDTGASSTVIDIAAAAALQLPMEPLPLLGGGVGTTQATVYQLPAAELQLGSLILKDKTLFAMDIQHVNQALAARAAERVDGVFGSDLLHSYRAIIDYQHRCLYLAAENEAAPVGQAA